jgi:outer membrane immunogenic protein
LDPALLRPGAFRTFVDGIAVKKTLIAGTALCVILFAGTALAADLPSKKAPFYPPPPQPIWTGFYVGLNAGGTFGGDSSFNVGGAALTQSTDLVYAPAFAAGATNALSGGNGGGFIGGGQIGYNWQFANVWVAGIEADIQGTTASGHANGANFIPVIKTTGDADLPVGSLTSASKRLDYLGTVRGRLGYLITPTLLAYATGGLAYGQASASASIGEGILNQTTIENTVLPPFFGSGSFSDTRVGWTVGGGAEWMFAPNWSAKIEYLYYDLGVVSHPAGLLASQMDSCVCGGFGVASAIASSSTRFNGHIVRAGVNYHFNWGAAAAIARY